MKRKLFTVLAVIIVFVVSASVLVGCNKSSPKAMSAQSFESMGEYPAAELGFDVDDSLADQAGMTDVEYGMYIYSTALTNMKNADYVAAYNDGEFESEVMGDMNYLYDSQLIIKTPSQYFYLNHRLIKSAPTADSAIFGATFYKMGGTMSKRVYYGKGDAACKVEQNNTNGFDANDEPITDWAAADKRTGEKIVFNKDDAGDMKITEHKVTVDTVKDMVVTRSEADENGHKYYKLTFSLDLDSDAVTESTKTISASVPEGSKASYRSIDYVVTVWDNGCFRSYDVDALWKAHVIIVDVPFNNIYHWKFSYNAVDCDLTSLKDAVGFVA